MTTLDQLLEGIEERLEKATPGPLRSKFLGYMKLLVAVNSNADKDLIESAYADLSLLVKIVREAMRGLQKFHRLSGSGAIEYSIRDSENDEAAVDYLDRIEGLITENTKERG